MKTTDRDREALEAATREQLREIAQDEESLGHRLRAIHGSLPVSPREDLMLLGEEDADFSCRVRGGIECALADHVEPLLRDLRALAAEEARDAAPQP